MLHDVFTLSNLCRYHPLVEAIKQLPKPWRVVKWSRRSTSATTGWDCWRFKVDGNSPDALWLSQFDSAASVQTPCRWIKGTILTVNTGSGRSCRPAYLKPSLTRPTLFLAKPTAISFFSYSVVWTELLWTQLSFRTHCKIKRLQTPQKM